MKITSFNDLYVNTDTKLSNAQRNELVKAKIAETHPLHGGMSHAVKVRYDTKTDRYVGAFSENTYKLKNNVAKFLAEHQYVRSERAVGGEASAFVHLHMDDDGLVDDVLMVTM
jgi:hypothetical protein